MTRLGKASISLTDTPYYHITSRCVPKALRGAGSTPCFFVRGRPLLRPEHEHRRHWIVDRIRLLSSLFAIDVCAYAVIKVIRRYKMEQRVSLQSFDWRALREVQTLAPDIATSYLTADQSWLSNLQTGRPGPSPWLDGLDIDDFEGSAAHAIKAAGGDIWSSYHQEVDAYSIKLTHQLGLKVNVWTVNETNRMRELIAMGVDGIITDYPDRLRQVAEELGLPLAAPTPVAY